MKHYHFGEISSTNDYASELLLKDDEVVVTADYQSKGRGRNNHSWFGSLADNLYFSYGKNHKHALELEEILSYQLIGCLAAYEVLSKFAPTHKFRMKYPNDVYALHENEYKKISGILVEHTFSGSQCSKSIIGIGINVNQMNFGELTDNNPVSLKMLGIAKEPKDIIEPLTSSIQGLLSVSPLYVYNKWTKLLNIIGKDIRVVGKDGNWIASSILPDSRLVLENIKTKEQILIDNSDSLRYDLE